MAYTYNSLTYGPKPWQKMLHGVPTGASSSMPAYVYVPGGGWGLRDPIPFTSVDPNYQARDPVISALDKTGGTYEDAYRVFVVNVASSSHNDNALSIHGLPVWDDATDYEMNDVVQSYVAVSASGPSNGGAQTPASSPTYWRAVANGEPFVPRVPGRGESSPAFGAQATVDTQRAIAYIRAHAAELGVDPDRIALGGSSAGGQAAASAASADLLAFGNNSYPTGSHPYKARHLSQPNVCAFTITPFQLDLFCTTNVTNPSGSNGLFLGFMADLYGEPGLVSFSSWNSYPSDVKKSVDGYRIAENSGIHPPAILIYTGDEGYDDPRTTTHVYSGTDVEGIWDHTNSYALGEAVEYSTGTYYVARGATTIPGTWSSGTNYIANDIRAHNGSGEWLLHQAVDPSGPGSTVVEPGAAADWDSGTAYVTGNQVTNVIGGRIRTFRATAGSTDEEPGVAVGWQSFWDEHWTEIQLPNSEWKSLGSSLGMGPDVHHSASGLAYFQKMKTPGSSGGWGLTSAAEGVLLIGTSDSTVVRRYTDYSATGATGYTEITGLSTNLITRETIGEQCLAFFAGAFAL